LYKAQFEAMFEPQFDLSILNDDFERSSQEAVALVLDFLAK
jgi:guanylate kinase